MNRKKIGLALGGGGARGMAHVLVLSALEEMGVRPAMVSGSSIGAIFGACLAAGLSARDIQQSVEELVARDEGHFKSIFSKEFFRLAELVDPHLGRGGWIKGERFLQYLYENLGADDFSQLLIPLKVVATDFWRREQVVLQEGNLLTAIKASMAVPGVFPPVELGERLLADGGLVNPLPYDLLEGCDIRIAVNVIGSPPGDHRKAPNLLDAVFQTVMCMQAALVEEKLKNSRPDILITPPIRGVRLLEFFKAREVWKQCEDTKDQVKRELSRLLEA